MLLDLVENFEPIGRNDWAIIESDYNDYAEKNKRAHSHIDGLRIKFDRLNTTKKPTGSSACP